VEFIFTKCGEKGDVLKKSKYKYTSFVYVTVAEHKCAPGCLPSSICQLSSMICEQPARRDSEGEETLLDWLFIIMTMMIMMMIMIIIIIIIIITIMQTVNNSMTQLNTSYQQANTGRRTVHKETRYRMC
jgi:hypothetical protein